MRPWPGIRPVLARINEPSPGRDVNVDTDEEGNTVTFYVNRYIEQGDELFLDYGTKYDRGGYGGG